MSTRGSIGADEAMAYGNGERPGFNTPTFLKTFSQENILRIDSRLLIVHVVMTGMHVFRIRGEGGGFSSRGLAIIVTGAGTETNDGERVTTNDKEGFHEPSLCNGCAKV